VGCVLSVEDLQFQGIVRNFCCVFFFNPDPFSGNSLIFLPNSNNNNASSQLKHVRVVSQNIDDIMLKY
jgi:hypothetical protein